MEQTLGSCVSGERNLTKPNSKGNCSGAGSLFSGEVGGRFWKGWEPTGWENVKNLNSGERYVAD